MQRVRHAVRENRLENRVIADPEVIEAIELTGRGWVAERGGQVVGFSIAREDNASIWALFVDPDHESAGLGSRLLAAAVDWLFSKGHDRLHLSTDPGTRADAFYRGKGWIPAGNKPNGEVVFELSRERLSGSGS